MRLPVIATIALAAILSMGIAAPAHADPALAPTTTTLTATPASGLPGATITVTATVSGDNPTGEVQFYRNGAKEAKMVLVNSKAGFSITGLGAGTHKFTAEYIGDGSTAPSTSNEATATLMAKTTSTTTLTAMDATAGATLLFSAHVTGASPTGTVEFRNNGRLLGTENLNASGDASLRTELYTVGAGIAITAHYVGDINNAPSDSIAVVNIYPSTTRTVFSPPDSTTIGSDVVLTATVTGARPSGRVSFTNADGIIGTATIDNGIATITATGLTVGTHTLTATYMGDTNNYNSFGTNTATVNKATSATTLTSSGNATVGAPVTFTATVTGHDVGGNVEFFNGGTSLGTAPLSSGIAELTTSALAVGTHAITAVYGGDNNNEHSTSATAAATVDPQPFVPVPTSVALATETTTTALGTVATLTATVTGGTARVAFARGMARAAVIPGAPSGLVEFFNNGKSLGTAPLNGAGVATLTTAVLAPGTHSFSATYTGSTTSASSASPAIPLTVAPTTAAAANTAATAPGKTPAAALPSTGSDPLSAAVAALFLLALGAATLVVRRRRAHGAR